MDLSIHRSTHDNRRSEINTSDTLDGGGQVRFVFHFFGGVGGPPFIFVIFDPTDDGTRGARRGMEEEGEEMIAKQTLL